MAHALPPPQEQYFSKHLEASVPVLSLFSNWEERCCVSRPHRLGGWEVSIGNAVGCSHGLGGLLCSAQIAAVRVEEGVVGAGTMGPCLNLAFTAVGALGGV